LKADPFEHVTATTTAPAAAALPAQRGGDGGGVDWVMVPLQGAAVALQALAETGLLLQSLDLLLVESGAAAASAATLLQRSSR
jgi:hypothetical protein